MNRLSKHTQSLCRHSDSRQLGIERVDATISSMVGRSLQLKFSILGNLGALDIPDVDRVERADELWQHTCFEAFIGLANGPDYLEFNFSPTHQWAAYRFDTYRAGMRIDENLRDPVLRSDRSPNQFNFYVQLDLSGVTPFCESVSLRIGVAAILEDTHGQMSYWALQHPPGKPDFHHSDCFALDLALSESS